MAVICKKCGGQHPMWDCKATAAQIAAYRNSDAPKVRRDYANRLPAQTRKSTAARKDAQRAGTALPQKASATSGQSPAGTQARPVDKKQRSKPAAKAGAGSSGRRSAPAATKAVEQKRGRGRPKTIVDMRAYKAQKERERRARLKQEKSK